MDTLTVAINQLVVALNQVNQSLQQLNADSTHSDLPQPQPTNASNSSETTTSENDKATPSPSNLTLPKPICDWFKKYQLGFDHFNQYPGATDRTHQLSWNIARHYPHVQRLLYLLSLWSNGNRTLNLNLRNKDVDTISHTTSIAHQMNEIGFLQHFQYKKSPHCFLRIQSNGLPASQAFLKGKWFELAVEQQLREMKKSIPNLTWVTNPVIRTPKGQQREIDLLIELDGRVFVVEITTSRWQQKATQIISLANQLQVPVRSCLIITPETEHEQMRDFSQLHNCKVLGFNELAKWLDNQQHSSEPGAKTSDYLVMESCVL